MRSSVRSIITITVLATVVWWMSANVVWLGDDLNYKYVMKGAIWQSWGWIKDWNVFWESQWVHYNNVNGRFVAHALVQLFNGVLGQKIFAVCNALAYAGFAVLAARAGMVGIRENAAGVFSAVCLSVICFVTKMMPTCQIGYIWGMAANLLWLSFFFRKKRHSWLSVAVMSLAGVSVGNWQEGVSTGVCAALGIWWLFDLFDKTTTFDWRRSWMMLGYFTGTAFNCLSPATLSRVSTVSIPVSDQLLVASYSLPAVVLLVPVILFTWTRYRKGIPFGLLDRTGTIPDGCLYIAIAVLLLFNFIVGVYSNRQLFGANLFALILTLRILPRHSLGAVPNTVSGICVIVMWSAMYIGIQDVRRQYGDIVSLHAKSQDGSVEYDRTRVMMLGHPSDAKYYEDILGQFDNDLHHSMMKDFKHNRKGKTLKLKPATIPDREKIEEYAPGHFYVTVRQPKGSEPNREIMVYGHYTLLGIIDIPASPRRERLQKFSRRRPPYSTAVIIPEYPLFTADSIILLP